MLLPSLLALAPLLLSQGPTLQIGATHRLPSFGMGSKNHASVAANANGDLCVVWHAETGLGDQHLVEAIVYRRQGEGRWVTFPGDHFVLGDPSLGVYGPGRDTCIKPAVCALGDGSFVAVWPRFDRFTLDGRLEAQRIVVPHSFGSAIPPLRRLASPVVLDEALRPGDGGSMPGITAVADTEALVAYTHEVHRTPLATGEVLRDYALRLQRMDWSRAPGDPEFRKESLQLPDLVAADDAPDVPAEGGLVLPEVAVDEPGHVFLAFEEFRASGRTGSAHDAAVVLVSLLQTGSTLTVEDVLRFRGSDARRRQRRPQLSVLRGDGVERALLAWGDRAGPGLIHNRARWRRIELTPQGPVVTPLGWSPAPGSEDFHPFPVLLPAMELLLASRAFPLTRRLLIGDSAHGTLSELWTHPPYVLRPSAALLLPETWTTRPQRLLAVSYEGSPASAMNVRSVYLQVVRF